MFKKANESYGRHGSEYLFVRFTKTLPIIKYSENQRYYRHCEVVEDRESRIYSESDNADRNSLNSDANLSNWTDVDTAASSLISFDTIPLQLNVPKQDRSAGELNDMTPIMTETDSDIVTPVISPNFTSDGSVTPIYGGTRLTALKIYLEQKLHEIERTSNADKKSDSSSSYSLMGETSSPSTSSALRKKDIKKQSRKRKKLKERKNKEQLLRKGETLINSVSAQLDYMLSREKRSVISFEVGNCKLHSAKGSTPAAVQKLSPMNQRSRSLQSNKMHSSDLNSRIKLISRKRQNSSPSLTHHSSRSRKNSSYRSRDRERSRRRGSSRKSPRSQSSSRSWTPVTLRKKPKTIPAQESQHFRYKQTNRKWEPSHAEQTKTSTTSVQGCENDASICRIESVKFEYQNFELPKYDYYTSTHDSLDQSDQLCDFHQASGIHMAQFEYSERPILNSESYYFQSPYQPLPLEQSNFTEICHSNSADSERSPFVLKGNILEIVPTIPSVVAAPRIDSTLLNDVSSQLDERIGENKTELIEQCKSKNVEINLKRKQESNRKRHLERFMRKEKLRLEIETLNELCAPIPGAMKVTLKRDIIDEKKIDTSSSKNENVSSSVGTTSSDKTSTEVEDTTRLLLDCTIGKLDSIRCRAEKEATIIKKETDDETLTLIDPEVESMPPPLPPDRSPPPNLLQPKLKILPGLIYFHYNLESNTILVSPYRTPTHIPKTLSGKTFPAPKISTDSHKAANSAFDKGSTQNAEAILAWQPNKYQQSPPRVTNSISSNPSRTLSRKNSFLRKSKSLVRHPLQHPQSSAMISRKNSLSHQINTRTPCTQKPLSQIWEPDICFPRHVSLSSFNNVPPQRPPHITWEQQQQRSSLLEISVNPPLLGNIQSYPGPNHPMFYENESMNFNLAQHQQQNDFRLNALP